MILIPLLNFFYFWKIMEDLHNYNKYDKLMFFILLILIEIFPRVLGDS